MRTLITIPGPQYEITARFVTYKTLCKHASHTNKLEVIRGVFLPAKNQIFVDSALPREEKLHVFFHELMHAAEFMLSGLEEEARVDAMARWTLALIKDRSIIERIEAAI